MTEIVIQELENKGYDIKVKGHAEYNPGNDIVCSAISQLICTYASLVEDHKEEMKLNKLHLNTGDVHINFEKCIQDVIYLYTAFIIRGFKMLEDAFPDNVEFYYSAC